MSTDISDHIPVFVFLVKVDYCQQISVTTFLFFVFLMKVDYCQQISVTTFLFLCFS